MTEKKMKTFKNNYKRKARSVSKNKGLENNKKTESKNKRVSIKFKNLISRIIILLALVSMLSIAVTFVIDNASFAFVTLNLENEPKDTKTVIVNEGDTLWNISEEYMPKGMDPRKFVFELRELNELDNPKLKPGQKIEVPIETEQK